MRYFLIYIICYSVYGNITKRSDNNGGHGLYDFMDLLDLNNLIFVIKNSSAYIFQFWKFVKEGILKEILHILNL